MKMNSTYDSFIKSDTLRVFLANRTFLANMTSEKGENIPISQHVDSHPCTQARQTFDADLQQFALSGFAILHKYPKLLN